MTIKGYLVGLPMSSLERTIKLIDKRIFINFLNSHFLCFEYMILFLMVCIPQYGKYTMYLNMSIIKMHFYYETQIGRSDKKYPNVYF